jgi:hypothetical protein
MYNSIQSKLGKGKFGLRKNIDDTEIKEKKKPTVEREKDNKNKEDKYNKFVKELHKRQNKRDIK